MASVTTARAFWTVAAGCGEIRNEPLPMAVSGDIVVRAEYSGVSRGTEALVFQGHVPRSEYARMRAPFQTGEFPFPVKYGYASVGVVETGPGDLVDRRVFVLHPHQTRYVVPAAAAHVVPDGVRAERAILAANLETAINGLWDGRPGVGDRIAVVGAGTVGCLVAWLARRIVGCDVELCDTNTARDTVAERLGIPFRDPGALMHDADLVFHTSGSPAGLRTALLHAGRETTVVDLSWYGDQMVNLALGEEFHSRRLTIRSSQVGTIPPAQAPRWNHRRRMALALSLLTDDALDVLITGESAFDELPLVMARIAASAGDTLCHRIRYE
jgi:NADPH:quinone reductase-like Zn-dependent oxidoreductase